MAINLKRFLTLRVRLFAGFFLLAAVSISAVAVLFQISAQSNATSLKAASLSQSVGLIGSLKQAVAETSIPARNFSITGDVSESKLWAKRVQYRQALWRKIRFNTRESDAEIARRFDVVSRQLDQLQQAQAQLFAVGSAVDGDRVMREVDGIEDRINSELDGIAGAEAAKAGRLLSEAAGGQDQTKHLSQLAVLLIGSFALGLSILANVGFLSPLKALQLGVRKIADGKLDHHIDADRGDELGSLAREFNNMTSSLKKSYVDLRKRYSQLTNLYKISKAVSNEHDLDVLLHLVLRQSLDLMGAETGSIMLIEPGGTELAIRAAEGLDPETVKNTQVKLGEGISGYVAASGKPLMIQDGVRKAKAPGVKDVKDALCVPLIANDRVIGVFNANNKRNTKFDRHDLRFFTTLAGQIAAAISNATLVENIREAYFNTIKVLAAAIDAKDRYTHGHSERVAKYTVTIARRLGLPPQDLTRIEAAAYLHDIGKIGVPDCVLNKEGPLTNEEFEMIKQHPVKAAEILGLINFPWGNVIPGVRGHHERYDGFGYPDGLAGESIPRDARIIAVADAFDAMTSDRPYRKGLDRNKSITELVKGREKQFDSEVVDAFIPALLTEWMSSLPEGIADRLEFLDDISDDKADPPKKAATSSGNRR
ncbi:MAG: GAF domain-containing protein [Actinomycetota bacterium]|nr:GAF domain-containing protein [Actinomycetota bacterium]